MLATMSRQGEKTLIIETRALRKSFQSRAGREKKTVDAVRGVDLSVAEGQIFGFLGPNGAGKTTTLRMLATLIEPDGGEATIAGVDLRRQPGEVRRRIGYVAQGGSTWDESPAREELVLQARLYGHSKADAEERAQKALASFQLTEYADRKCKTYSGGQRRRVVSERVSTQMLSMLRGVVVEGTGTAAAIPGYTVAGKTGTAAKIDADGRYSHSRYVASFVGLVPATKPRLVIMVMVDEPHGSIYGGDVAAPAFREIARFNLQHLEVPPDAPRKPAKQG